MASTRPTPPVLPNMRASRWARSSPSGEAGGSSMVPGSFSVVCTSTTMVVFAPWYSAKASSRTASAASGTNHNGAKNGRLWRLIPGASMARMIARCAAAAELACIVVACARRREGPQPPRPRIFPTLSVPCLLGSDIGGSMSPGGQTTVIQRILERRAERPPTTHEETTATIAVMLRVVPPPQALLVCQDAQLRREFERRITADMLDCQSLSDEGEAVQRVKTLERAVVVTDSLELVRNLRARPAERAPYILFISELDEDREREAGLRAGADDCVGRRASEREIDARIGVARRIAELEAVLRVTLAENRKLSATDDLTRLASRRFFSKHFPREIERAARYGRALALILCDIDLFKAINDSHGHAAGDQILKQFGA